MKRLPFVDWTRGFAVVAMVLWHTGDAWLRPGLKAGQGFFMLRFVGGLAAPSFLLLAGLAAALAYRAEPAEETSAMWKGVGRGLEIVVVGYALRLQSWLVDAQAFVSIRCARAWLPLAAGYLVTWFGARAIGAGRRPPRALWLAPIAIALALAQVPSLAPGRLLRLLQVDVLQCIGATLCVLALLQRAIRVLTSPARACALGVVVASVSELLSARLPGPLPIAIASYLGRLNPENGVQPALFPLFPWFAYACFGAALGRLLKRSPSPGAVVLRSASVAAVLGLCTSEALPFVHHTIRDHPWTVAPIRTGFRSAIVCTLLTLGFAWVSQRRGSSLIRLGQHSLRIYWAHMLFAYGVLARPIQRELGYASWGGSVLLLVALMWLVASVRVPPGLGARLTKNRLEPERP